MRIVLNIPNAMANNRLRPALLARHEDGSGEVPTIDERYISDFLTQVLSNVVVEHEYRNAQRAVSRPAAIRDQIQIGDQP